MENVKSLEECRARISDIDRKLEELFIQRMAASADVAAYKKEHGLPVFDRTRERDILSRVVKSAPKELGGYAKVLFSTIMDLSRSYQSSLIVPEGTLSSAVERALSDSPALFPSSAVVGCMGLEGAYAQAACDKLFRTADILYFHNFEGVFQAVESGLCQFGVLPIENTTAGTVAAVYDLMRKSKFHIVKSLRLQICNRLLVKPGTRPEEIKEVISHDHALKQCSEYLNRRKDLRLTMAESTAKAAKIAAGSGRSDLAAIASGDCGEIYGLQVLDENIQNSDYNYTRFICIAKDLTIYPGANRISLVASLPHRPGELYRMIARFSALGLNLTKLESRPIPGKEFEYLFYFDLEGSVQDPQVLRMLSDLENDVANVTFLGNYQEI